MLVYIGIGVAVCAMTGSICLNTVAARVAVRVRDEYVSVYFGSIPPLRHVIHAVFNTRMLCAFPTMICGVTRNLQRYDLVLSGVVVIGSARCNALPASL